MTRLGGTIITGKTKQQVNVVIINDRPVMKTGCCCCCCCCLGEIETNKQTNKQMDHLQDSFPYKIFFL